MQMFQHAFFPFFPVYLGAVTAKTPDDCQAAEAALKNDSMSGAKPVNTDVEQAGSVMIATKAAESDGLG